MTGILNKASGGPVSGLLLPRRPAPVPRFVVSVVVWEAINRVFRRWARPHVGEEVLEGIPAIADGDVASAVDVVVSGFGIGASLPHGCPGRVLGSPVSTASCTVSRSHFFRRVATETAAAFDFAANQAGGRCDRGLSAITEATPCRLSRTASRIFQDREP